MDSAKTKTLLLMRGNAGKKIAELKKGLRKSLGADAAAYAGLASGDKFCADTETALRAWQLGVGLVADGIAGPRTLAALGVAPAPTFAVRVDAALVGRLFPYTRTSSIARNLPYVCAALAAFELTDADMVAVALGTIRAETEGFVPIAELPSHFNTLPGHAAFSAYENKLGNKRAGDGARYRGRGFVQLTGRGNYEKYGKVLDIALADNPDCACAPEVAACLLSAYLDANKPALSKALAKGDLKAARKVVNGGQGCGARGKVPAGTHRAGSGDTARDAEREGRCGRPARPALPAAAAFAAANLSGGREHQALHGRLHPGRAGAGPGAGRRVHRLRPGLRVNYLRWRAAGMPKTLESANQRGLNQSEPKGSASNSFQGSQFDTAQFGWWPTASPANPRHSMRVDFPTRAILSRASEAQP